MGRVQPPSCWFCFSCLLEWIYQTTELFILFQMSVEVDLPNHPAVGFVPAVCWSGFTKPPSYSFCFRCLLEWIYQTTELLVLFQLSVGVDLPNHRAVGFVSAVCWSGFTKPPSYSFCFSCLLECICTLLAGMLAMPLGSACFIMLLYHPLHDWHNIHSEVPVLIWIGLLVLITWVNDRQSAKDSRTAGMCSFFYI